MGQSSKEKFSCCKRYSFYLRGHLKLNWKHFMVLTFLAKSSCDSHGTFAFERSNTTSTILAPRMAKSWNKFTLILQIHFPIWRRKTKFPRDQRKWSDKHKEQKEDIESVEQKILSYLSFNVWSEQKQTKRKQNVLEITKIYLLWIHLLAKIGHMTIVHGAIKYAKDKQKTLELS